MAYLLELDAYTLPSGPLVTFRYSSGAGMRTQATDTPPLAHFSPRLAQPWLIRRDLFDKATTYGGIKSAKGQVVLQNTDGALDALLSDYALDGREVRVWIGTEGQPFPAAFTPVGRGIVETVTVSNNQIQLGLRDRLDVLDLPLLTTVYAGNNALPAGVEGVATDIGGKQKPRLYGAAFNVTPYHVNTSRDIYQVSDQTCAVSACYDRGVLLTAGADYVDLADMQANGPAASTYRVLSTSNGTYLRLGTVASGTITVDAATSETRTASLIQQIALDAGLSAGDVVGADVAALNTANPAPVGVWLEGTASSLSAINALAESIGASVSFDNNNQLRMGRYEAPSGASVLTLSGARIVSLALISTADSDKGIPPWQVKLHWGKVYTVQADLKSGGSFTTPAHAAAVAQQDLTVTVQDTAIQTAHPLAPTMEVNTLLTTVSDATTEANRRLNLYKVGRQMFQVQARLAPAQYGLIDLGVCLTLQYPRYGLKAGMLLRVAGIELNAETGDITLRLWG